MALHFFTSESVCAGHPDKICDQVSDSIVDAALSVDKTARVAVETLVTTNQVVLAGEVTSSQPIEFEQIARQQISKLGYTDPNYGFSDQSNITVHIHQQSPEIAQGVNQEGAGDQGMMFGFACQETPELMPLPIMLAHDLTKEIDHCRKNDILPYLRPDGKSQVTVRYEDGRPVAIERVVIAVPHAETTDLATVSHDIFQQIVQPILERRGFAIKPKQLTVNGTGVWHQGGPASDTGVTGRKIIVDTYGGYARVGGGCFSGKDPTKVDRSGAYGARFLAKNIVAAGLATKAEVLLAYCIGQAKPVMQTVETFGTSIVSDQKLKQFMNKIMDTSVSGLIRQLNLYQPIFTQTASYGHFGRPEFSWEEVKVE